MFFRLLLAAAVTLSPMAATSEAGFFRNIQARREARGAPLLFPRLRARAHLGRAACGSACAASACAACPQDGDCAECVVLEGLESRQGRAFLNALRLMAERQNLTSEQRRAFTRVLADPLKREMFREEVGRRFGIDVNNIEEWLELFIKYAPQIIEIIVRIASLFGDAPDGSTSNAMDSASLVG